MRIERVSFENFLQFWSVHNRQIIEFVFVTTFIIILLVIYRQFFAKTESTAGAGSHGTPVSIDTSEIEEKLKKILENQSAFKTVAPDNAAPSSVVSAEGAPVVAAVDTQELEKLRNELKQKELAIDELKKASAVSAAGGVGASKEDTKKFEDKIKELEGRLQEYEIISEDIADLSFYKEENARLQKELGAKGGAPVPEAAPSPVVAASVEPVAPVEVASAAVDAEAVAAAAAAEMAPAPVEASAPVDSVIDDDILKEFAAAVEGQKATEKEKKDAKAEAKADAKAAEAAAAAAIDPAQPVDSQKLTESKELMGEFENFIKKG
ncbi:MAG: hypothetical protein JNM24_00210 [Bdellovibrionaceae bacterium]|nr:hypothetical protein [Pseudobdellovibrionaceae bacterium]